MSVPKDPYMLLSYVNMKLRDGDYESLEDFCKSEDIDCENLKETLSAAGFSYDSSLKRFG